MTVAASASRPATADTGATIQFKGTQAHVVVQYSTLARAAVPENVEAHCMRELRARTPNTFWCSIKYKADSQEIELVIQNALLNKLPRLATLKRMSASGSSPGGAREAQFDPPCSVWGLVSLLLLIEGQVEMLQWFSGRTAIPVLWLRRSRWDQNRAAQMLQVHTPMHVHTTSLHASYATRWRRCLPC